VAQQEKWLRVEAQSRGYQYIDQLAKQNYPLFEKLAELWRKKNPAANGVLLSRGENRQFKKAAWRMGVTCMRICKRLKTEHDRLVQISFQDMGRKLGFLHKLLEL